jgi:hypothetical protein
MKPVMLLLPCCWRFRSADAPAEILCGQQVGPIGWVALRPRPGSTAVCRPRVPQAAGIVLPRDSRAISETAQPLAGELQPGDLVFFNTSTAPSPMSASIWAMTASCMLRAAARLGHGLQPQRPLLARTLTARGARAPAPPCRGVSNSGRARCIGCALLLSAASSGAARSLTFDTVASVNEGTASSPPSGWVGLTLTRTLIHIEAMFGDELPTRLLRPKPVGRAFLFCYW